MILNLKIIQGSFVKLMKFHNGVVISPKNAANQRNLTNLTNIWKNVYMVMRQLNKMHVVARLKHCTLANFQFLK